MKEDGEWGEFFPIKYSPSAYNDTVANDYFELSKEEALAKGYRWQENDPKEYRPPTSQPPENIKTVSEEVLKEVFACECDICISHAGKPCGKNYKINPLELAFYMNKKLPIPRFCPDCRHNERQRSRNPLKLRKDNCSKCSSEIETSIPKEKNRTIYCEKCYQDTIY